MNILYVITGLGLGGAERVVVDLADKMSNLGHKVVIAYLTGEILVRPKNINIDIIALGLNNPSKLLQVSMKYRKLIHSFQPDVVHAHMFHANIFVRLCRLFIRVPRLICSAHSKNEGGKLRMLAYKFTHNLADITTNVSQEASESFIAYKAVPDNGIMTVYNGIDLEKFQENNDIEFLKKQLNINKNAKVFIAIGRFHDAKDYPNLIRAYYNFLKNNPKKITYLIIVGDGDLSLIRQIKKMLDEYSLHENILLLGRRNDIAALLNLADFFVLSSKYEGLPTVVIEAMACGTFVVATDCGGCAEIMGDTGILVQPQNSEALAKALNDAINKTSLEIKENNLNARHRIENLFSLEKSIEVWLSLYERI